jgi:acetyl esterase/lipase
VIGGYALTDDPSDQNATGFRKISRYNCNVIFDVMKNFTVLAFSIAVMLGSGLSAFGQAKPDFTRSEDVIYGRKFGTALTLDIFRPSKANGFGIIFMVSGGFFSSHDAISAKMYQPFLERGYAVFAVVHGSQPKFVVSEIEQDIHRAVRFIRHNASQYGVSPDHLGITGGSAGGHLSLTMGTQGGAGKPDSKDPVERESSAVQCVACFYPPTDFLNWGKPGEDAVGYGPTEKFSPAFGARNATAESRQVLGKEISPIYYITSNMPPTLIIHGDSDKMVPLYQSEIFVKRCEQVKAPVRLIVREGKDHGWPGMEADMRVFADWFDQHLRGMKVEAKAAAAN